MHSNPPLNSETLLDREPTSLESTTNRNLSSQKLTELLDEPIAPDPEQQAVYDTAHAAALDRHNKAKLEAKAEADVARLTPEGKAYADRLKELNKPVSRLDAILARVHSGIRPGGQRMQCLDYYDAKRIVTELLIVRLARKNKSLVITKEQKPILQDLTAYFIGDPASSIPLTKGVYLYGAVGVGKTFILSIMQALCKVADIEEMKFTDVSTKSLIQDVVDQKNLTPIRKYFAGNVLFDDLGEEKQQVKLWGDGESPMDLLLTERYKAFEQYGYLSHFTSNLTPPGLSIYGTRLFDRFSDMTHPVLLPGGSKRGNN